MMADAPDIERIAKVEIDLRWTKIVGGAIVASQVAIFWQLYRLNAEVAALAAGTNARLDAMDAKLDAIAATLAVIAGS